MFFCCFFAVVYLTLFFFFNISLKYYTILVFVVLFVLMVCLSVCCMFCMLKLISQKHQKRRTRRRRRVYLTHKILQPPSPASHVLCLTFYCLFGTFSEKQQKKNRKKIVFILKVNPLENLYQLFMFTKRE